MMKKNTKSITLKHNALSKALVILPNSWSSPHISIYFYNKNEKNSNSLFSNEKKKQQTIHSLITVKISKTLLQLLNLAEHWKNSEAKYG